MIEQHGGGNGASESGEIRGNVVDRGDEPLVHDVGDSYEETAREGHGQKQTHHMVGQSSSPWIRKLGFESLPRSYRTALVGDAKSPKTWEPLSASISAVGTVMWTVREGRANDSAESCS